MDLVILAPAVHFKCATILVSFFLLRNCMPRQVYTHTYLAAPNVPIFSVIEKLSS